MAPTHSHGPHVVLRQQGQLQQLGLGLQGLVAGRGHRLARDAVDLVEGVRAQETVVRRADEQLKAERLTAVVAAELDGRTGQGRTGQG